MEQNQSTKPVASVKTGVFGCLTIVLVMFVSSMALIFGTVGLLYFCRMCWRFWFGQ